MKRALLLSMTLLFGCPEGEAPSDAGLAGSDAGVDCFCPSRLRFTGLAQSVVHVGWTGVTHNNGLPEGAQFVVDVRACDDDCRNCSFEGPTPDPELNLQRCLTDTSLSCSSAAECPNYQCIPVGPGVTACANNFAPCAQDSDCAPGECSVFLGGNSASPIRANCFAAMFRAPNAAHPVEGRIDLETGQLTFDRFGLWIVSSDVNRNPGFCPVCVGDMQRNDGKKEGICSSNPHGGTMEANVGRACDAHGNSGIPIRAGVYSLDCSVPMAPSFDLSTYRAGTAAAALWTLDPNQQPACTDGPCWCGVCEGTALPCHEQADCSGAACVADVEMPAVPPRSNRCIDACGWDNSTLSGTCNTVVGQTDAGEPIIAPTPCFPGGITAEVIVTGTSERLTDRTYSVGTAGLGCAGPGVIGAVNQAIGLPGLSVSVFKFRVDAE